MAVVSAVHLGLAHRLPALGGLLLHASAVRAAGWAFVFPGPTETGKTIVRLEYPGRVIWLDMWIVTEWSGNPSGRDGQALKWVEPSRLPQEDILEADQPIVAELMRRAPWR
jgi:hypothetical protein